ncbi:CsbD family protein [Streptomyces sp. NPDC058525]|uniref:CsbD family protein n=1 Tax=unclassified Streptomyces TaxID=2593676 RepID=UPI003655FDB2
MSGEEKMRAKKEQATGKAKETMGRAVGNERLTTKGRAEKTKGDARGAKEKIKDTIKDTMDK